MQPHILATKLIKSNFDYVDFGTIFISYIIVSICFNKAMFNLFID
jgi:hypothetical protein